MMRTTVLITQCSYSVIYSKTSDSGPSEIGTQYNKPLNKGRFSRSQIIGLIAYSSNTF